MPFWIQSVVIKYKNIIKEGNENILLVPVSSKLAIITKFLSSAMENL